MSRKSIIRMKPAFRRGFTLIELLVVVAVIALLIGILLPALGSARGAAWELVSNARKRDLMQSQSLYAAEYDDFIPGVGTSGLRLLNRDGIISSSGLSPQQHLERANTYPDYPTSAYDWASPAQVGDNLPTDRAERMWYIWEQYGCPTQTQRSTVYLLGGGPMASQSRQQALDLIDRRSELFPGSSFLQPAPFAFWGRTIDPSATTTMFGDIEIVSGINGSTIYAYGHPNAWSNPVRVRRTYSPRFSQVGTQSRKIALADGFRYHDGDEVDFDARLAIDSYGPWTSSGAIFRDSTAYGLPGISQHPTNQGRGAALSYRHRNRMGAAHFDISVRTYSIEESHNPELWYPSGSRWTGIGAQPNSANYLPPAQGNQPQLIP